HLALLEAVLLQLLGEKMVLGNLQLFFIGIGRKLNNLHPVQQRRGDGGGGVGGGDEHTLAEVKGNFQVVVPEGAVLLGVQDLQQRRRGIAPVVAAQLVDFI